MIHQDSIVQWLDLNSDAVNEEKISTMFGQYIVKSKCMSTTDNLLEVEFDLANVHITDWKGWSCVQYIKRRSHISHWIKIMTKHGKTIMATPDTLIMVYNPHDASRGFHGETKYGYKNTRFDDVKKGDIVRVRHTQDEDGYDIDFDSIEDIMPIETGLATGYQIITKSGFCNCNDFYIFGKLNDI